MWRYSPGEKQIDAAAEEKEPWLQRRVRERSAYREMHKNNFPPKPLAWREKKKGANFHEFLQ